jgi:hypothetical protein
MYAINESYVGRHSIQFEYNTNTFNKKFLWLCDLVAYFSKLSTEVDYKKRKTCGNE